MVFRRAPVERVNRHSQMTGFPSSIVRPSGFVENVAAGGPPSEWIEADGANCYTAVQNSSER